MNKTLVPKASQPSHKFPLHCGHITTSNFMRFDVAFARELKPCKIKFNHQEVVRTLPFKKPLYSNIMLHNTAFFVPFRTVWEPFTDFKENVPHNQPEGTSIISNVPLIDDATFIEFITGGDFSTQATAAEFNNDVFDFSTNGTTGYKLNYLGKYVWSVMVQLGYRFNPRGTKNDTHSALPLLCLAKAYLDFYFPNGYAHYGSYAFLDGIFQRNYTYSLTANELLQIFTAIRSVCYNDDYFVNAFDNPTGPNDGVGSFNFVLRDVSMDDLNSSYLRSQVDQVPNGTPVVESPVSANQVKRFSQYNIETLERLSSYVRRHQLAGSRSLERYLLDNGIALTADKLRRCIKIEEKKFPLQVGEVLSSADTYIPASQSTSAQGAALGDYAGRAIAYNGDLNFEFETDEFGYLFVISTIVPSVGYVQGYDRSSKHKTVMDFYTGEMDGLVTPIDSGELFVGLKRQSNVGSLFGFTGAYPEYKETKDRESGLFLFPDTEKGLLGWESNRKFSDKVSDSQFNVVHSLSFMLGMDSDQYERIFMDAGSGSDKFIIVHRDNFEIIQDALPLFDFFDWYDEDHQKIRIDVNGVKTN